MTDLLRAIEPRHFSLLLKLVLALAASELLVVRALAITRGRVTKQWRDVALAVVASLAFVSWWHSGATQFGVAFHRWEFFHYYLGSKYSPELGYTRLYDCAAAVEAEEDPPANLASRWTRNLETNVMQQGSAAALDPSLCKSHFTLPRWLAFKHDLLFFRHEAGPTNWTRMQVDHGYNATPVWNAVGYVLSNTGPASRRQMTLLALIDPALIILMWGIVWWAFGWRAMAIAIVWWGTNFPARYFYVGGSYWRSDYLVTAVIGIALAKRGYVAASGALVGWSALLRIFPGFLTSGAVFHAVQQRPAFRTVVRFAVGGCVAVGLLFALSLVSPPRGVSAGLERWQGFERNSDKHLSGSSLNRVGLKPLLSFSPDQQFSKVGSFWIDSPEDSWQLMRRQTFAGRRVLFWTLVAGFLVMLTLAVRDEPFWASLVLGVGLIPIVGDLACYYYAILLVYGFLWERHPWAGAGLTVLAAFTLAVAAVSPNEEIQYALISAGIVLYVYCVTGTIAWRSVAAHRRAQLVQPAAGTV